MNTDFHKIRRLPPYVFEQVNRTKAALRAQGADIIDLGMGNPDMPTPEHIVDKLCETARRPDVNGYSASRGIKGLRRAVLIRMVWKAKWFTMRIIFLLEF